MIEFFNENDRPTLPCAGIFISIPIARLVYRLVIRYLVEKDSESDEKVLLEFIDIIHSKLDSCGTDY